ncbi:MAG: AraC family transcriptional regulator [Armatimonadota bacterium]
MLDVDSGAEYEIAKFPRSGVLRDLHLRPLAAELSRDPGWESGSSPATLAIPVPLSARSVSVVGIFALGSDRKGSAGASLVVLGSNGELRRENLVAGRHYRDASATELLEFEMAPDCRLTTVGCALLGGTRVRLDVIELQLPSGSERLIFQASSEHANFVIFDVVFEVPLTKGKCPFHTGSGGVSLAELGGIVRMRDRVRFTQAVDQLVAALDRSPDLEEARSEALTFLAIVTAGMLEAGGDRSLHRVQLEAARRFDQVSTAEALKESAREMVDKVVGSWLYSEEVQPQIIDRALSLVDRNYSKEITDDYIAGKVGMSTSHFRYLFKQSVGQPFHKYLVATRLEKARMMLEQGQGSVSEIGVAVGFSSLATFSRAFAQRFGMSPSDFKKVRGL